MKTSKLVNWQPLALAAIGVIVGHGAQADTILDFTDQVTNAQIPESFGDNALASSSGVSVVGFGTPNIGLDWQATGSGDVAWQYYNDAVWIAAQLNNSAVGNIHRLTFAPNNPSARVVVKSFNFHPYYDFQFGERFTYDVSVLAGTTVVSGPIHITFQSDATTNHPVSINYTGALGQTLELQIARVASTLGTGENEGDPYDIAVDDIVFAQLPETVFPFGPEVVSVTPANGASVAAVYYPYLASITNGATTLVAGTIQLRLDGSLVSPAPTISSAGGMTNVSYLGTNLLTIGSHTYTLTYGDNIGSSYTNQVQFIVNYAMLPTAYALPPGAGVTRGFTCRTVSASTEATNQFGLPSTIARAIAQLNGTLTNPVTSLPFTNSATPGTNADGSFSLDTVLNFDDDLLDAGNFTGDVPFPGLDSGFNNSFSTDASLYLNLAAGYYRFGVNSDDGFEVSATPPQGAPGSPIVVGLFDNGRGADDTLFDFLVQTSGIYPFRVIYFEGSGSASCEFYSVTNIATGDKVLVNDLTDANAIKSYRVLAPRISSIVQSGSNVVIDWAYGTPPFQVKFKNDLSNPLWSDVGSPTMNRTATVPILPGAGFIRVEGQ